MAMFNSYVKLPEGSDESTDPLTGQPPFGGSIRNISKVQANKKHQLALQFCFLALDLNI